MHPVLDQDGNRKRIPGWPPAVEEASAVQPKGCPAGDDALGKRSPDLDDPLFGAGWGGRRDEPPWRRTTPTRALGLAACWSGWPDSNRNHEFRRR